MGEGGVELCSGTFRLFEGCFFKEKAKAKFSLLPGYSTTCRKGEIQMITDSSVHDTVQKHNTLGENEIVNNKLFKQITVREGGGREWIEINTK